jgi:hypothetical protein
MDEYGNEEETSTGMYSVWDEQTQSWVIEPTTLERATAYADSVRVAGYRTPYVMGYGGQYRPVAVCTMKRMVARAQAQGREDELARTRRASVIASLQSEKTVGSAESSREEKLRNILAANVAALESEVSKKKCDTAEIMRLRQNCEKLRGDLGIETPEG